MLHGPGHGGLDGGHGPHCEQRVSRACRPGVPGILLPRRDGSPGGFQQRSRERPEQPGAEHELVGLRGDHGHVHQRLGQLDPAAAGTCSRGDQYAAFWVGLDGYSSNSVEQTGSEVDCIGRTAQYYAWYEMYPNASVTYSNTVRAGDHFNASVTYEGSNSYSLFIADTTQGWSHTTVQSLSGAPRSSAEVIVEAPCCTFSGGILPLTDFGTMSFTGSDANGSAIGNAGGVTEIIMVDNAGRDKDSISSLSGGTSFSATWLRSN
jgi:hypothetical protein